MKFEFSRECFDEEYLFPYHHLVDNKELYLHRYLHWGMERYGIVQSVLDMIPPGANKIADVGCGDGAVLKEVRRNFPTAKLDGYDMTERGILLSKAMVPDVDFYADDFENSVGGYDVVLCIETLEHISDENIPKFVKTLKSKVRPGGTLIVTVPSVNLPLTKKHYRHYTRDLLLKHLEVREPQAQVRFIHQDVRGARFLNRILCNRYFVLNWSPLRRRIFTRYDRLYRWATERKGSRVLAAVTP